MSKYAIVDNTSNVVKKVLETADPAILAANTKAGQTAVATTATVSVGMVRNGNTFTAMATAAETSAQALTRMLATIDDEADSKIAPMLTSGASKKYEYANKAREVRDYRTLSGTVIALLLSPANIAGTRERFAWAMAEADDTGDSLETVITRYETAMTATQLVRKLAARAQKLKRALRAAPASGRDAIFNARSWPTS